MNTENKLNCRKVKELLPFLKDRETASEILSQIESHIMSCRNCAQEKEKWEKSVNALRETAAPVVLPEGIELRLHQKLAEYNFNKNISDQIKKSIRVPWFIGFTSGAVAASFLVIIAGVMYFNNIRNKYTPPTVVLPQQMINVNQNGILDFNIQRERELKNANIEIILPEGVAMVRQGREDISKNINWNGELLQGENIFSIDIKGMKQGEWHIKLRIKDHNESKDIVMPVKVTERNIKL